MTTEYAKVNIENVHAGNPSVAHRRQDSYPPFVAENPAARIGIIRCDPHANDFVELRVFGAESADPP